MTLSYQRRGNNMIPPYLQLKINGMFVVSLLLMACTPIHNYSDLTIETVNPSYIEDISLKSDESRPRIAVAFGGGGARGLMHLGVIKALLEHGIDVDIVTGTSVGSIAAVLYSDKQSYDNLEQKILSLYEREITDFIISQDGFLNGNALNKWTTKQISHDTLSSLPIKTGIIATDITQQRIVMITDGPLGKAVQTSSTVPGVFVPVTHQDSVLIDGGVLSLVPIYAARQLGADIVIGVDIFCGTPPPLNQHSINVMANTFWLQSCITNQKEMSSADVLIQPKANRPTLISLGDKEERQKAIILGYQATLSEMKAIKELININPT